MVSKKCEDREDIVWLHLSDAHLCAKTGWDAAHVIDKLRDDLQKMAARHGLRPDLIFFTGDLVWGNIPEMPIKEQFSQAHEFFEQLRNAFDPPVPTSNVFIVPGNHDIDRKQITEAETYWLDGLPDREHERAPDKVNEMIRDANKQWKQFMERLSYYNEFLQTLGYEHLAKDPERLIYCHTVKVAGLDIGIAGLNSSWSCGRDNEKGKLWLGRWQIGEAYRKLKHSAFSIALIHHPINWFTEHEDPDLARQLEMMFQFHLHGHEHKEWVEELDGHVRIAAGACYDSSRRANGYNFVRLFPTQNIGEVFLRRYDKDGGGWIPHIVYEKTDYEGKWSLSRGLRLRPTTGTPPTPKLYVGKRVAILPIRAASGTDIDPYLLDGFCDDISTRLSKVETIHIVSLESTLPLRKISKKRIIRNVEADIALIGKIRETDENNIHLNVHLIEVKSKVMIWSESFDFQRTEIGRKSIEVATSVADALKLKLSAAEEAFLRKSRTVNAQAYELYLRGVGLVFTNQETDLSIALSLFTKAIELDEMFADAHAFKAYALWRKYFGNWNANINTLHEALQAVEKAKSLEPSSCIAKLAFIRICWDIGYFEEALKEGQGAIRDSPGSIDSQLAMARAYHNAGMADKALPLTRRVLDLDPANPTAKKLLIWNYLMTKQLPESINTGIKYLCHNPGDTNTAWAVVMAYMWLGSFKEAITVALQGLQREPYYALWLLAGYAYRADGDNAAAIEAWTKGIEATLVRLEGFEENYRTHAWLANLYAAVGDRGKALKEIELVYSAEPNNNYLLYRLAHAYAE